MDCNALMLSIVVVLSFITLGFIVNEMKKKNLPPNCQCGNHGLGGNLPLVNQISLDQLKTMTPAQIGSVNINSLMSVIQKYLVNYHGIPTFPTLESELSADQYNAFWNVFNPGNKVY